MVERFVKWAIDMRAVLDLLSHPSIMSVEDPRFETYDLICKLVKDAGDRAAVVGLDTIAQAVRPTTDS